MTRARSHDTPGHVSPRGRIDATPATRVAGRKTAKPRRSEPRASGRRRPLSPGERRLITTLKVILAKKGLTSTAAGRQAGIDPGDARRVLAGGEATPRTLRKLFEAFNVNEYTELSAADRREALLLEIHAAAERQAELLGALAALAAGDDPPGLG